MRAVVTLAVIALAISTSGTTVVAAPTSAIGASLVFGGSGFEMGLGVTDSSGNLYVTGVTRSTDFPVTAQAAQSGFGGGAGDAFVAKVDRDGNLVYATYLGGSGFDEGRGIAVDEAGRVYVVGETRSDDFPTVGEANRELGGTSDAFFAQLDPNGSLRFSTLFGGQGAERAYALTLDSASNAYVTGETTSADFPTTEGAYDRTQNGDLDAYLTKFASSGAIAFSTVLGGPGFDHGLALVVDASGNAYVTGKASPGYPVTAGAYDTTQNGGFDVFVSKLDASGSALVYSTYVGGASWDEALGIAVDEEGNVYFTGNVQSQDYPVTPGSVGGVLKGNVGVAVTKLSPNGSSLVYSGLLGGSEWDEGDALAVDSTGAVYIAGHQASADFPTTEGAWDTTFNGVVDGFLVKVDPTGSTLVYSTFLGGSGWEGAMAMSIDDGGSVYLTGATTSANFPGAIAGPGGDFDVFATRIDTSAAPEGGSFALDVKPLSPEVVAGQGVTYTVQVLGDAIVGHVTLAIGGLPPGSTATFAPSSGGVQTVRVQTSPETPPGRYQLVVFARIGEVQQSAAVELNVHCCPRPG